MIERILVVAAAAALCGCASYTPQNLSAMSADEICYLEYMQGGNLSAQGRQAIQAEMQRRNDNCGNHAAQVKDLYADFIHRETYLRLDP